MSFRFNFTQPLLGAFSKDQLEGLDIQEFEISVRHIAQKMSRLQLTEALERIEFFWKKLTEKMQLGTLSNTEGSELLALLEKQSSFFQLELQRRQAAQ